MPQGNTNNSTKIDWYLIAALFSAIAIVISLYSCVKSSGRNLGSLEEKVENLAQTQNQLLKDTQDIKKIVYAMRERVQSLNPHEPPLPSLKLSH